VLDVLHATGGEFSFALEWLFVCVRVRARVVVAGVLLAAPSSCLSVPGPQQPLFAKILLLRTPTWINFPKDEVLPFLKERESDTTVYHSPIGFKNAKA
jgi:hypothetical protein